MTHKGLKRLSLFLCFPVALCVVCVYVSHRSISIKELFIFLPLFTLFSACGTWDIRIREVVF